MKPLPSSNGQNNNLYYPLAANHFFFVGSSFVIITMFLRCFISSVAPVFILIPNNRHLGEKL